MFNKNDLKYQSAVSIIRRLKENNHEAYLVGGCVRDALLGIEVGDYDIATSCLIQDIPKIFKDAIYIGQAFGVCMVKVKAEKGYYTFDLATFRWDGVYTDGRHPSVIKTATVEEDAKRRDFTINALYYDPVGNCECLTKPKNVKYDHDCSLLKTKDKILDFVQGQHDLGRKLIRAVGDPKERFREDKLRMLRAVRLSFQLNGFKLEEKTEEAIRDLANELLPAVSYERIWQEIDKASKYPDFDVFFSVLDELGLLVQFLPETKGWNGINWENVEYVVEALPQNTPTLIKLMAILGTFEKKKVLEIVNRFKLPKPNWV